MKQVVIASVVALLVGACASQNGDTSVAAQPEVAAATDTKSDKLVCAKPATGSRLSKKALCMTKEEWAATKAASQEATRNMQQGIVTERQ